MAAQQNFTLNNTVEKIYLQLDANTHLAGDNLYFKAIVTHIDGSPTSLSGVLYADLIDAENNILESQLIKLTKGTGSGAFRLPEDMVTGKYLIRAYTRWSRNFGEEFYFKEYIQVYSKSELRPPSAFLRSSLNNEALEVVLDPLAIDSLHKRNLTVFLDLDGKRDTLSLDEDEDKNYQLRYPISENLKYATLQIETRNGQRASTTLAMDTTLIDLQFFPESGVLAEGLPGKLGFKALDYRGNGIVVSGYILNQKRDTVAHFSSNKLGMGAVRLEGLVKGRYTAVLDTVARKPLQNLKKYTLPKSVQKGNLIMADKLGSTLSISVLSNYLKEDSLGIALKFRGRMIYSVEQKLTNGFFRILLPSKKLPDGIISVYLTDQKGNALAERLVYNHNPQERIQLEAQVNKDTFGLREETRLTLNLGKPGGKQWQGEASVVAVNSDLTGGSPEDRNILSYLLLESELEGEIESPGYYFTDDGVRWDDLDALLLTQGWRKYLYTRTIDEIEFEPQPRLQVAGTVSAVFSKNRPKEGAEVSFLTFDDQTSVQVQETDSLGRFSFDLHAFENSQVEVLIQTASKTGNNKNYNLEIDDRKAPKVQFIKEKEVQSVFRSALRADGERESIAIVDVQPPALEAGTEVLDEVLLSNYTMTPERQQVMDEYGEPDVVVDGKEIQSKERKWSYGLYSILLFEYGDIVRINRDTNQVLRAQVFTEPTLVVVDGIPVLDYAYDLIPNIDPGEVKSFEIIRFAKNFSTLYSRAYPNSSPLEWPTVGHVIAIYTHAGIGLYGTQAPKGILTTALKVFEPTKTFYAPTYPQASRFRDEGKDIRAVVHWEPHLKLEMERPTEISFYNTDIEGEVEIIVETVSTTGEIGYLSLPYVVAEKSK